MSSIKLEDRAFASLPVYISMMYPGYEFADHHKLICKALQAVEQGKIKRLIISMPPRHGKSFLCSEFFPAWYLGRNPDKMIITASYGTELAEDFGRKVRNQLLSDEWQLVFPTAHIDKSSRASGRFNMKEGGSYFAVGVGGATTGRGSHILLIDDPVKNREEADSDTIRRKIKDWYRSVAYTRLMKDGAIIIIMTRWHEDDLAGWCLQEQEHEHWALLSLPALAEADDVLGRPVGKALWPERYDETQLEKIRQTVGTREWNALYMQRPAPEEGLYFKKEWFQFYEQIPPYLNYYGASDYAVTEDGGDYTVHVVVGVDINDNVYVIDLWREQSAALAWIENLMNLFKFYKPQVWAEEQGVILKSLDPIIRKRMDEESIYSTVRKQFASSTDKATRARSLQARLEMGKIFFPYPRRVPWMDNLMSEFLSFPAGTHDDMVDAMSLCTRLLIYMQEAKEPKKAPTFREELEQKKNAKIKIKDLFDKHFKAMKKKRSHA